MLYLGHFSFDDDGSGVPWHAAFTCVVEAGNVKAAVKKFERLIRDLAAKQDVFDGAADIYLDSCVELRRVPRGGVMSYISVRHGQDVGGISAALLGARSKDAVSYAWGREPDAAASGELVPAEPFLRLRHEKLARKDAAPVPAVGPRKDTIH